MNDDMLEVGRITKPHGLKGDVLVKFVTDMLDERTAPGAQLSTSNGRDLTVERAAPHKDRWIVHFADVDSREAADSLHGQMLLAPALEDSDDIFVHQVIGSRLQTADGVDHGEVVSVVANPASDLMELGDGRLVPMVFIVSVEPGQIVVDVPDGLLTEADDGS